MKSIPVWDWPIRLFHWVLVGSVLTSFVTIWYLDAIGIHVISGIVVCGAMVFRLLWGFVGSTTARFGQFFPTPRRLNEYLRATPEQKRHFIGHSPVGALSKQPGWTDDYWQKKR